MEMQGEHHDERSKDFYKQAVEFLFEEVKLAKILPYPIQPGKIVGPWEKCFFMVLIV